MDMEDPEDTMKVPADQEDTTGHPWVAVCITVRLWAEECGIGRLAAGVVADASSR